jgi:hypothetical protein
MDPPAPVAPDKGCLVIRTDYGYPAPPMTDCRDVDLAWEPLAQAFEEDRPGKTLRLFSSEMLLAWAKTRGGADLTGKLRTLAAGAGLVLVCRFPRVARELLPLMGRRGREPHLWETPTDGRIPPLYERWESQPQLLRLHLEHEWLTGTAAARGGVALLRVAWCLAEASPLSPTSVAGSLGITTGAARSYLTWMEDAALARRAPGGFSLRHPLLNGLFRGIEPPRTTVQTEGRPGTSPGWDPIEID